MAGFRLSLRSTKRRQDVDMTQGNIMRHIISFALPLLLGNLFQQLYNTVDTWVVGNFVSDEAYSAVGTIAPIINTLIGFFMGLSSGAGVVISQFYGAQQHEQVKKAVHTSLVMTLCLAVLFTGLGIFMIPYMLQLMNMPASVTPEATTYLTIYFAGIIGLMLYNIGSGILRAIGDSTRPFYYLVVCAVLNTVLDLFFVLVLHMGVEGVALATILSQAVSAFLVIFNLMRTDSCVKVTVSELRMHWKILKKIFYVGIPAALQLSITSFSNVFVQSYINFFGPNCMGGWTTYTKVDQLLFLPMQSVSLAATTFVGQNLGKNQPERARQGVRASLLVAIVTTVSLMIPVVIFAPELASVFNSNDAVVSYASLFLRWLTPFYVLCCINQVYAGALRGAGNARACMIIMLSTFVGFRQIYLFSMSHICNMEIPIAMAYPAGWLLCSAITAIYYHKVRLGKTRLVDDQ
ncbi:MAG: MATE family efflux transporter [Ruminococcaceae bacterium]|nr:MATE family efflux transporter [Oscillospiraceae bacterium]